MAAVGPKLSRAATVSLGVCALLVGLAIAPVFPIVVIGVCSWWLYDDLVRDPAQRPGWLGAVSLGVFALAALAVTGAVTVLAVNADCGADLFGEGASNAFDQACADRERWRSVVAVTLALIVCGLAAFGVRRSDDEQSPTVVVARTFGVSGAVIAAINIVLVGV